MHTQDSIAKDTMAVCCAVLLLVGLLLGATLLSRACESVPNIEHAAAAPIETPAYVF